MSHTELHIWIDDTHNPIEKHCEISTIHQFSLSDKGHSRGVSRDAGATGPVRKEEPARLPFIM